MKANKANKIVVKYFSCVPLNENQKGIQTSFLLWFPHCYGNICSYRSDGNNPFLKSGDLNVFITLSGSLTRLPPTVNKGRSESRSLSVCSHRMASNGAAHRSEVIRGRHKTSLDLMNTNSFVVREFCWGPLLGLGSGHPICLQCFHAIMVWTNWHDIKMIKMTMTSHGSANWVWCSHNRIH